MLVDYRKCDTPLHKLNPHVILFGVLVVIIASIIWTNPIYCVAMFLILLVLGQIADFPWKKISWFFKMIIIPVVFIVIIQGFTLDTTLLKAAYKDYTLFYLLPNHRAAFKLGGLLYGLAASLKIYMVVIAIAILGYIVSPSDIIQLISRLPFASKQFVFIFSTAWRFIPVIQNQIVNLMDAQKTRGMELQKGKLSEKVKKLIPIVTPLLSNSLEIGDQIALTMESRAFGMLKKTKFIKKFKFTIVDKILYVCLFIFLILMFYTYRLGYGIL